MEDDDVRGALRTALATATPPPPMSPAAALRAGRRARRRRSTVAACGGSAVAVAAVAAAVALSGASGGSGSVVPGGPGLTPGPSNSLPAASDDHSGAPWPTGPDGQPQEDRTAKAGPRYDQGVKLLAALTGLVPRGFSVPDGPGSGEMPLRYQQAQFEDRLNGTDVWSYMATTAIIRNGRTGSLLAEVHTAGNELPTEPCAQTLRFWGMAGTCHVVTVGSATVGVVDKTGSDRRYDRWASYRYADGVVAYVAVARAFDTSHPALTDVPYTAQQLAELAVDSRFDLT